METTAKEAAPVSGKDQEGEMSEENALREARRLEVEVDGTHNLRSDQELS